MLLLHRRIGRAMAAGMVACAILAGVGGGTAMAKATPTHTAARPTHITPHRVGGFPVIQPSGYVRAHIAGQARNAIEQIPFYLVGPNPAVLGGLHTCLAIGNDGNTQGVECADVVAESEGQGLGVRVAAFVQAACQSLGNPNSYPQCAEVDIVSTINNQQLQPVPPSGFNNNVCGHEAGPCVNGAVGGPSPGSRNQFLGVYGEIQGCNQSVGGPNEVWAVDEVHSVIELPGSAKELSSPRNLASGHAIVCGQ